jgi:hypothetical protein
LGITRACQGLTKREASTHIARNIENFFAQYVDNSEVWISVHKIWSVEHTMARYRNSTFAALRLTAAQESDFTDWVAKEPLSVKDIVNQFTGDGFKVSVSWVFDQSSFCLSVIGTDETKDHRDMVMTSWSDDLDEVARIAAYKHYVLCEAKQWPSDDNTRRWG